jgi:hypothetical protein
MSRRTFNLFYLVFVIAMLLITISAWGEPWNSYPHFWFRLQALHSHWNWSY